MTNPLSKWLDQLKRDGLGPVELPAITRGRARDITLELAEDFSDHTFAMQLRAAPDAGGSALATFTCTPGSFSGGVTPIVLSLAASAQTALPADEDGSGIVTLVYDLIATPPTGAPYRLLGGLISVSGAVTQ